MTTTALQVPKNKAVALFLALGLNAATKWNPKRMAAKLAGIAELVDDKTVINDKETNDTLEAVLAAIEAGTDIEVVEGEAAAPTTAEAPAAAAPAEDDSVNMADAMKPDAKPKKKAATRKAAGTAPAPAAAAARAPGIPGVREGKTRPYLAGIVIREAGGLEKGITDEMVQKLDKLYGKDNPTESLFSLKNAWHAIRGFKGTETAEQAATAKE